MNKFLLISIFTFLHVAAHAQFDNLKFKHYTTENGLSQASIYQIYQDKKGFIWLATWDGLNRFDGYQFTVFKPNLNDNHSIKGSRISSIIEDDSGYIWVGTYEALNQYNPNTNTFTPYYISTKNEKQEGRYNPFYIDDKNELWFIFNTSQLGSIHLTTKKITQYAFAAGAMQHYAMAENKSNAHDKGLNMIYTCGSDGLHMIDLKQKHISDFFSSHQSKTSGRQKFIWQVVDDGLTLWLATQDGLYSLSKDTKELTAYPSNLNGFKATALTSLSIDRKGMMWCGTEGNGLWAFNLQKKQFVAQFAHNSANPHSLANNILNTVHADKEDNIWVNTDPYGLEKVNPYQQFFQLVTNTDQYKKSYSNAVWSICPLNKEKAVICFNQTGPVVYNFKTGERREYELPHEYKNISIYHVAVDRLGQIWMATDFGLFETNDTFKHIHKIHPYNKFNVTLVPFRDEMLLGTENGVITFSLNAPNPGKKSIPSMQNIKISTMVANSLHQMLIATLDKDLVITDTSLKVLKKYHFPFIIKCILPISDSIVWLGTNMGLVKLNVNRSSYISFTESEGLANQYIYGIQKDKYNNLWISSNKGISRFDQATEEITNFDLANGLQGWEFNTRAYSMMSDGTMLFGGVGGLNYFTPELYKPSDFNSPLEFIKISINHRLVPLHSLQDSLKPILLNHDQNNISVEYVALDYMKSNSMSYYYKLHEADEWNSLGNKRTLELVNMKPGTYDMQIQVRASNKAISKNKLKLYFEIEKPIYQRWWFYLLCLLLISGISYSIFYYKTKSLKQIERIRNKLSRDLHDDIGSTLSSINILSRTAQHNMQMASDGKIKSALEKISERSQRLLLNMSDIIWNINPMNDSTEEMINRMREYATTILEAKEIEYHFFVPETSTIKLPLELKSNLYLIFKEAVNNLSKYSGATQAKLSISFTTKSIHLSIADNGKGFDLEKINHRGGLLNMQQRAEAIKGRLNIISSLGNGTTIELSVSI